MSTPRRPNPLIESMREDLQQARGSFLDMQALRPSPVKKLRWNGAEYAVRSARDLKMSQYLELKDKEDRLHTMTEREAFAVVQDKVKTLVPDFPVEQMLEMTSREFMVLSAFVSFEADMAGDPTGDPQPDQPNLQN